MQRLFDLITHISIKRPKLVLGLSVVFTLIMVYFAAHLRMEMTWLNIIPKKHPSIALYNTVIEKFGNKGGLLIAVEHPVPESLLAIAEEVRDSVEKIKSFTKTVTLKQPEGFLEKHALMLIDSSLIERVAKMITSLDMDSFLLKYNDDLESEYIEKEENLSAQELEATQSLLALEDFIYGTQKYIRTGKRDYFELGTKELLLGPLYFKSLDNKMVLISVQPRWGISDLAAFPHIIAGVDSIRNVIKKIEKAHNHTKIMDTGMYSIMRDEYVTGMRDMNVTTVVSFILVIALFIIGFRIILAPILAGIPLLFGILWDLGLTQILFGRLNMMTAMMAAILIGLGIDYSIHILQASTEKEGIEGALPKVGRGLVIGAFTTALAFLSLYFTSFDALKELGVVVGLGCITTVSATIFVLPALITLFGKKLQGKDLKIPTFGNIAGFVARRWYIPIMLAIIIIIIAPYGITHMKSEANPIKLEAKGLASVAANDTLVKRFGMSTDYLMALAQSYEESDSLATILKKITGVSFVEGIHLYCPPQKEQKYKMKYVKEIHRKARRMTYHGTDRKLLLSQIERLKNNILELKTVAYISGLDRVYEVSENIIKKGLLDSLYMAIKNAPQEKLKQIGKEFFEVTKPLLISASTPEYIAFEDVPTSVKEKFVSEDGKYFLLTIFSKGDIWNDIGKGTFIDRVSEKVPATGMAMLMRVLWTTGVRESRKALILVFTTILILLLIDFRSIPKSLISYVPVTFAFFSTLVVLGLTGVSLNFLNVLAFPLIIGIGIDDAVHVMHRYIKEGSIPGVYTLIGRAIFYTTLTTGAAFGSLLLGKYRGYPSFAIVILVGISLAFLYTLFLLPPLLRLVRQESSVKHH